jgi:hypothetical protein
MMHVYYFHHIKSTVIARSPLMAVAFFMDYQGEENYTYTQPRRRYQDSPAAFITVNGSAPICVDQLDPTDLPAGFMDAPEGTVRPMPMRLP